MFFATSVSSSSDALRGRFFAALPLAHQPRRHVEIARKHCLTCVLAKPESTDVLRRHPLDRRQAYLVERPRSPLRNLTSLNQLERRFVRGCQRFTLVLPGNRNSPRLSPQPPAPPRGPAGRAPDIRLPASGTFPVHPIAGSLGCSWRSRRRKRQITPAKQDDRAKPAGPTTTLAGDALLDHAATQVGVNQTPPVTPHDLAQRRIGGSFATGETRKRLCLEFLQS